VTADPPIVVVTGATGGVGRMLVPALSGRHRLRLHGQADTLAAPVGAHDAVSGDLERFADAAAAVAGADAVVHLAAQASPEASWEEVDGPNITGTFHLFEAARQAGVRRVVFASTNHVTGMYDRDHAWRLRPDQPVRPDSLYGVSKAFGEALGRYYSDAFGLQVLCLRLGSVLERPVDEGTMGKWLSPRDLAQLVARCLQTEQRFGIYYGVSANTRGRWDITNARRELGYAPQDDSEAFADEILGSGS
jgi:NAD+ dependent glucose-6-phosphate dehydrogenase